MTDNMSLEQTPPPASNIIEMRDVAYAWPGSRPFAIAIDRFSLAPGSRTLLLGPSGGGKSTLLSLISGVVRPNNGSITLLGTEITQLTGAARDRFRAEHLGIIFQMFNLLPYGSVIDNVVLPLSFARQRRNRTHKSAAGGERAEARRLLGELGLSADLCNSPAANLSVGQQQRVAVARALIGSPEIIIADEPTSALDKLRQTRFLALLFEQVAEAGATLIMVSHDEALGDRFDQVVHLGDIVRVLETGEVPPP